MSVVRTARVRSTGNTAPVIVCTGRVIEAEALQSAMLRAGWHVIGHPSAWRYCRPLKNGRTPGRRDYTRLDRGAVVFLTPEGLAESVVPADYFAAHYDLEARA